MSDERPAFHVSDAEVDDLRRRLHATRWPQRWPDQTPWRAGVPHDELARLVRLWAEDFDWRRAETAINALPWHLAQIGGSAVRYLRFDGSSADATPIVLLNGWPSTFLELVPLAQRLASSTDGIAFTVVVPVLPGFAGAPQAPALPPDPATDELVHRLMTDVLGFTTYVAHGGDLGAGTASLLAQAHPEAVAGLHLLAVADPTSVDGAGLSAEERAYVDEVATWTAREGAYEHQQMTRPLTLGYGLSDSPAGLLAWILEKYHDWTDHAEEAVSGLDDDFILTQASLYWFTNTIGTSFRPYFEYAEGYSRRVERVDVPTAVALFPRDLAHPPRSWAERTYAVTRYTRLPRGGHFAAAEVPDLLAEDIRAFARALPSDVTG